MCGLRIFIVLAILYSAVAKPLDHNDISDQNDKSSLDSSPPMEFPQNDSQFPLVDTNATLVHELEGHDSVAEVSEMKTTEETNEHVMDQSKIDTEVSDLLRNVDNLNPVEPENGSSPSTVKFDIDTPGMTEQKQQKELKVTTTADLVVTSTTTEEVDSKAEVEWIQNGHDNEDVRLMADEDGADDETIDIKPSSDYMRENVSQNGVPLVQGRHAAILAAIFVVVAVVGYAAMLSWRRYLENRYGNRQMLINEEDLYSANDMKHFSL